MIRKTLYFGAMMCMISALTVSAYAAPATGNSAMKDFTVDSVKIVEAENGGTQITGNRLTSITTDTRTQEQRQEDEKKQQIAELQAKIEDITKQLETGEIKPGTGENPWNGIPGFGDWIDSIDTNIGQVTLPDWMLPSNGELNIGQWQIPDLDQLWQQFLIDKGFDGNLPIDTLITGLESPTKDFEGVYGIPTNDGMMTVSQQVVPVEVLAINAGMNAGLKHQPQLGLHGDSPISVTDHDSDPLQIPNIYDIPTVINQEPFDYDAWFNEFAEWIGQQLPTVPGTPMPGLQDLFIRNPNIDGIENIFPGTINDGKLPGTDIEIGIPKDYQSLYELLLIYMAELQELNMNAATVTKITMYQIQEADIQTIHTSIPSNQYRWLVTGPGGSVESHTNSPIAKLLFRSAGTYRVRVYNTRDVYRNNKVSGLKTEVWVLSNGGAFDGMVVYQTSSAFSGYISEDIGPTVEEVELKKNGFQALVSESMLNQIQMIDSNGNIHSPAEGFSTERK